MTRRQYSPRRLLVLLSVLAVTFAVMVGMILSSQHRSRQDRVPATPRENALQP